MLHEVKEANMPQFRVLHVGSTELAGWRHTCVQSSGPTLYWSLVYTVNKNDDTEKLSRNATMSL